MDKKEKWILSNEDWYPTEKGQVRVRLSLLSNNNFRVSVWGADDFGLERDFAHVDRQAALKLYGKLVNFTSQRQMRAWGMINA